MAVGRVVLADAPVRKADNIQVTTQIRRPERLQARNRPAARE